MLKFERVSWSFVLSELTRAESRASRDKTRDL